MGKLALNDNNDSISNKKNCNENKDENNFDESLHTKNCEQCYGDGRAFIDNVRIVDEYGNICNVVKAHSFIKLKYTVRV